MNQLFKNHPLVVDKHLARILGLNEALILQQVHYWLEINKKNNRNCHQGRYWTYNTINEWQEEFPFWSTATIKRTFKKLREANLIITDNFNSFQMDRTLWYTINYEELKKLMIEVEDRETPTGQFTEEAFLDTEDQNHIMIGTDCIQEDRQSDPMDKVSMNPPLPEISTETSPKISNPSIYPDIHVDKVMDRRNPSSNEFETKYEAIMKKCELCSLDERYREAVAHALKLLLLEMEKSKRIKIGDQDIPVAMVENDIQKLDFFTIEHAVNKFKEASARIEIRNTVAYLKTCIYNAISEMKLELDARLRYTRCIG